MGNIAADYTTKDCYKLYKKNVDERLQVEYSDYMNIIKDFNEELRDTILYESSDVKLPCGLGRMRIKKFKLKLNKWNKLSPNWQKTLALWKRNPEAKEEKKLVYHLNEHRSGHAYRVYWDKRPCKIVNHSYYKFIPARKFARTLSVILRENFEIDYYL